MNKKIVMIAILIWFLLSVSLFSYVAFEAGYSAGQKQAESTIMLNYECKPVINLTGENQQWKPNK